MGKRQERVEKVKEFLRKNKTLANECFDLSLDNRSNTVSASLRQMANRKIVRLAVEAGLYSKKTYHIDAWGGLHRVWRKMQGLSGRLF